MTDKELNEYARDTPHPDAFKKYLYTTDVGEFRDLWKRMENFEDAGQHEHIKKLVASHKFDIFKASKTTKEK